MKTALTIAGSDSCGGAGIQADIKTMTANGVYAMSAITSLTAQNTVGVQGIFEVSPEFLSRQIDSIFTDIRPDAVKIGMVFAVKQIDLLKRAAVGLHAGEATHLYNNRGNALQLVFARLELARRLKHVAINKAKLDFSFRHKMNMYVVKV